MNSAEFLKLVERYPLPWEYEDAYTGRGQWIHVESDEEIDMRPGERCSLHDAAPAMAAAILGLASRVKRAETGAVFDMEVEIEALCAALPEELRP